MGRGVAGPNGQPSRRVAGFGGLDGLVSVAICDHALKLCAAGLDVKVVQKAQPQETVAGELFFEAYRNRDDAARFWLDLESFFWCGAKSAEAIAEFSKQVGVGRDAEVQVDGVRDAFHERQVYTKSRDGCHVI